MNFHKTCPECGHIVTAYTINLSERMVDAFKIFVKKFEEAQTGRSPWDPIGLKKWDIGLDNSQYSNFQNLRYFEIIYQSNWEWFPTSLWMKWYRAEIGILSTAWMMAWQTLLETHEARITHPPRKMIFINDIQKKYQDHKEKYQEEATKSKSIY